MTATPAVPGTTRPGAATPGDPGLAVPVTVAPPNLPAPGYPLFPPGYQPAAADFCAWWYLNAAFHQKRVVFRARQTIAGNPVANDSAPHVIHYDTIDEDPWQGWSPVTFAWTPRISGFYIVTVTAFITPPAAGTMLVPCLAGTYSQRLAVIPAPAAHNAGASGASPALYYAAGATTISGAAEILTSGAAVTTSVVAGQVSAIEVCWVSS